MKDFSKNYGKVLLLILGIVSAALLLFDAFTTGDELVSGVDLLFGRTEDILIGTIKFNVNIKLLIAFVLPIVGGIIAMFKSSKGQILVTLLLFVASIVLLLLTKETPIEGSAFGATASGFIDIKLATLAWISVVLQAFGVFTTVILLLEER